MAKFFIQHTVRDYAAWRPAYDAHESERVGAGLRNGRVYRNADAPNDILIVLDADDVERAKAFGGSANLRAVMEAAGVISAPVLDIVP